jgi:hypothetical protein
VLTFNLDRVQDGQSLSSYAKLRPLELLPDLVSHELTLPRYLDCVQIRCW